MGVVTCACRNGAHFIAQHEAQCVNAMHTNISQRASRRQFGIVDPGARAGQHRSKKVGARYLRASDCARRDSRTKQLDALLEPHHMCHTQHHASLPRRLHHGARFGGVHRQRLFAEYGLAVLHRRQHVRRNAVHRGWRRIRHRPRNWRTDRPSMRTRAQSGIAGPTLAPAPSRAATRQPRGSVRCAGTRASAASPHADRSRRCRSES